MKAITCRTYGVVAMTAVGSRDQRFAALAAVLARAVVSGEVAATDAGRVLRHELRRRNTNRALHAPRRSVAAQIVIERCAAEGRRPPANDSPDALHCDHVFALTDSDLASLTTQEAWLARLPELDLVVCVTAAENYRLEQCERKGTDGWAKYPAAGVELVAESL